MAPTPVKMAPTPVKIAPTPVIMAPTPVKMASEPEPANPFITPKFNNTVKPPDIVTSPPAPKPLTPPTIAQVQQKEPKTEIYYAPDCFQGEKQTANEVQVKEQPKVKEQGAKKK